MFPTSLNKNIDPYLKTMVGEIEIKNPNLSVFAARQFRYSLYQNSLELTIKESRPFNVLEEFIIRAAIEFKPAPTPDELAAILALDPVFVHSTISVLQSLQTLAFQTPITVTQEGRLFYEKGTVPQPAYNVHIYANTDILERKFTLTTEAFNHDVPRHLPDLSLLLNLEDGSLDTSVLTLTDIQEIIQSSHLSFHLPETGKIVTGFKILPPTQMIWKLVSLFVVFDVTEHKFQIQIRSGKRILPAASTRVGYFLDEGRISLSELCDLPQETINFLLDDKNR
ncbi:hypothetical protein [Cylindrospermopsis raciborskii]|nr:hypothetical protein [Cylindrospermopsis raciborskii]MEB3146742.1 hypothetical protein [Cylindrospermopsis raciborskii]UJS05895.1 hypothetical protein L3I90_06640 [Cylindrospermopsis raciborskii KLL07]